MRMLDPSPSGQLCLRGHFRHRLGGLGRGHAERSAAPREGAWFSQVKMPLITWKEPEVL